MHLPYSFHSKDTRGGVLPKQREIVRKKEMWDTGHMTCSRSKKIASSEHTEE